MKKMRLNLILSKKHMVLSALVVSLSCAVYLNWEYVKTNSGDYIGTEGFSMLPVVTDVMGETEFGQVSENYGEAFFAEAKLSRTKSRDQAVDVMKYMLADSTLSDNQIMELTAEATVLAKSIEVENKIENIIKAHGFTDCMVYYDTDKVDVMVQCENMSDMEAAQITDAILSEVSVDVEKISIIEIK